MWSVTLNSIAFGTSRRSVLQYSRSWGEMLSWHACEWRTQSDHSLLVVIVEEVPFFEGQVPTIGETCQILIIVGCVRRWVVFLIWLKRRHAKGIAAGAHRNLRRIEWLCHDVRFGVSSNVVGRGEPKEGGDEVENCETSMRNGSQLCLSRGKYLGETARDSITTLGSR